VITGSGPPAASAAAPGPEPLIIGSPAGPDASASADDREPADPETGDPGVGDATTPDAELEDDAAAAGVEAGEAEADGAAAAGVEAGEAEADGAAAAGVEADGAEAGGAACSRSPAVEPVEGVGASVGDPDAAASFAR
jgi:hypothetical protein